MCVTFIPATGGFGCEPTGAVAATMIGAGVGGLGAAIGSWNGVRPGQATSIETGSFWGSMNGLGIGLIAASGLSSRDGSLAFGLAFHGGMLAGTAGGIAAALLLHPRDGAIGLMKSGGLWAGAIGMLLTTAAGASGANPGTFGAALLVSQNIGLTAAGIASAFYRTSRWRMLIVDLSALLGLAIGMGTGFLVPAPATGCCGPNLVAIFVGGAVGLAAGFGIGLGATHALDASPTPRATPPLRTSWLPLGPEGRPGLTLGALF
jgi:hypothetical protein